MSWKADIKTIREALKSYRNMARTFRYGGMAGGYEVALQALEMLDRLERELKAARVALCPMEAHLHHWLDLSPNGGDNEVLTEVMITRGQAKAALEAMGDL